jgi:hypothetical protein
VKKALLACCAAVAICAADHAEAESDAVLRRQNAAFDKIFACTDEKYKHHHSECGRRVLAQVPVENRSKAFMDTVDLLAKADELDSALDKTYALFDRRIRAEQFTRDLKAAKSSAEMLGVVTRYCTGHGELHIGMTQLEVQEDTTWCVPSEINETITAGTKRQQEVYYADRWGSGAAGGIPAFCTSRTGGWSRSSVEINRLRTIEERSLEFDVSTWPAWHYPGHTLFVTWRAAAQPTVQNADEDAEAAEAAAVHSSGRG